MAFKQRVLDKLNIVKRHMICVVKLHEKKPLDAIQQSLLKAKDLCREGLPTDRYVVYGELYDGLILVTQKLKKAEILADDVFHIYNEVLQRIIKLTEQEKRFKKELVFLPYQASMWDSLESVWKAANVDKEHCKTYVIPIPYAELTPEHTVAEWHWEGYMFPNYVPIMNWKKINLQEMHPDVIFIHNPYDNCNRVTSIDERYYSKNLKKYTNKLVYIPYAVEEEIQPGDEMAETAIEHRILLPVFFNADLIFAQSEDMRQAWIDIMVRRTNVKSRIYWEKRIYGLGSPKIDKVLSSKKEDFDMPDKWKKMIKNKKIILYITSISLMLRDSDKVCDKLRYVFSIFRNRNDVILWWRPHPLMRATFHSMRPQYEEEYCSLEKQFIKEGWGIYDNSSDLHRAICWSDAYYGDYSSVLILYERTGKPILLQSFTNSLYYPIGAFSLKILGSKMYYVSRYVDCLVELDLISGKTEWYPLFHEKKRCITDSFGSIDVLSERKLLLAPFSADEFIEYDVKTHVSKKINVAHYMSSAVNSKFFRSVEYKSKIFYYSFSKMTIIVYDKIHDSFHCLEDSLNIQLPTFEADGENHYLGASIAGHLIIGVLKTQYVIDVDMEYEKIILLNLADVEIAKNTRIISVSANESLVAFGAEDNKIVFWVYGTQEWFSTMLPNHFTYESIGNVNILLGKTYALCYVMRKEGFNFRDIEYVILNIQDWSFSDSQVLNGIKQIDDFYWWGEDWFWLWAATEKENILIKYNLETGNEECRYILSVDGIPSEIFVQNSNGLFVMREKNGVLERWLEYIRHGDDRIDIERYQFGNKIYDIIKQME